jgi:hypothetical protein
MGFLETHLSVTGRHATTTCHPHRSLLLGHQFAKSPGCPRLDLFGVCQHLLVLRRGRLVAPTSGGVSGIKSLRRPSIIDCH